MSVRRTPRPRRTLDPLEDALRALVAGLKAAGRPSMIIGGIAVIARGVPRLTRDIDATVAGAGTDIQALAAVLGQHQIVPRVERLIALHGEHMDLGRVRAAVRDLAATLDEPQRTQEFERLLARARAPLGGETAASPSEGSERPVRKRLTGGRVPTAVDTTRGKKAPSRVAAQQAAAPDSASNRATRGRTRRG